MIVIQRLNWFKGSLDPCMAISGGTKMKTWKKVTKNGFYPTWHVINPLYYIHRLYTRQFSCFRLYQMYPYCLYIDVYRQNRITTPMNRLIALILSNMMNNMQINLEINSNPPKYNLKLTFVQKSILSEFRV